MPGHCFAASIEVPGITEVFLVIAENEEDAAISLAKRPGAAANEKVEVLWVLPDSTADAIKINLLRRGAYASMQTLM
jgi:hypothetical protein